MAVQRQEQGGGDPRGRAPGDELARHEEHEQPGAGHERDPEPLAEGDRIGDLGGEPEQGLVAVRVALDSRRAR
ncbi:MAG: hypothetical protein M3P93_00430 [Actinomycetota bacterium]|nr:hypothetical protein [Actinomycetota bacterium]